MERHDDDNHASHGRMNHGMGMMILGCGIPIAAILILPSLGVSPTVAFIIGIGGMIGIHAGMMILGRIRARSATKRGEVAHAGHDHP